MLALRRGLRLAPIACRSFSSPANLEIWRRAEAVCFDVDSTVIQDEGIDVLAAHCGQGDAVSAWTSKAMNGGVKFEDALAARLNIIQPSKAAIDACLAAHPPTKYLTKGIQRLIQELQARSIDVYLVSGGFRLMIEPVAAHLGIPPSRIYANTIHFHADGSYKGFDANELTSRDGGKPRVIELLKRERGYKTVVMVGDGATDMQAKPPADLFVGYGGVVARQVVQERADWFLRDFEELIEGLAPSD
ncbi:phosphoserine phosphatase SerB [Saprolegnia diclina VS20]|uniref:phosphoserine phosphatase n=1 Tax=Saprolegnia diclina (strain VS20) TaxID=1156394 RepID=T0Q612_SAPDV|nr:phosphoserine phosphatase SerB [Saprolegnia diclina VS20]EQC33309.1 phosphoserine phosphatase SerB [Saprolegnia diclina VS20]|eukprot:XP_008613432.1 phosphoserine phosphatase SerB [Saprolegnia diclina VS20]